jgi:hypothetical protein
LKTPLGQVRRIEPLPAKQGPYLARSGAVVSLLEDAQLVLGGKPASLWLDLDLGIYSGAELFPMIIFIDVRLCTDTQSQTSLRSNYQ